MAVKTKSNSELRESIFKKIGYLIEYQDLETDDDGDEIEDSEEGYFWADSTGERSDELFETDEEAISDCLAGIDLEIECSGVKLSKMEKGYLTKEYGVEIE
jgi:hypothetical protein